MPIASYQVSLRLRGVAAAVSVEVVPGVTSTLAGPELAGIPVTHGLSQGFTVVSGDVPPGHPQSTVDWAALARSGTTLVLLMAVDNLATIAEALLSAGLTGTTPAACVMDGGTPRQRVVTASLGELSTAAATAQVTNPAVVVIGDVAGFAPHRLAPAPAITPAPKRRILVLGGVRSGKSATAERILAGHDRVRYVATGPIPGDDDPTWAERVRAHRQRRPHHWQTVETLDVEPLLTGSDEAPALLECLATWLAGVMDKCGVWDERPAADAALAARVDRLAAAWRTAGGTVVAVSNEVGCGVVPHTPSGRRFRDELGWLNSRIAAESDEVWLCTAGIPQRLR